MVIIDPGHGGMDLGKGTNVYFSEKDKILQISLYQYDRLNTLGIKTFLTRDSDELVLPNKRIERINFHDSLTADILISNHLDYQNSTGGQIIYASDCDKHLIDLFKQELNIPTTINWKNSNNEDFYYILRETKSKNRLILIYGNTSSVNDLAILLENWVELSERVIKTLCKYLAVNYLPPKEILYVIKKDDTLKSISHKFNVSIETIKRKNNLTNDEVFPFGLLKINV